ncbi:hypothetical protein CI105_01290 [Candidatus Izimaplasma bacterium ZiA1]|uniref:ABC transporter ATP-binding protein/permease n=1 Tax=Candidatus Izimoplasma sp. ZiA1 TaxID=2024899 RepID=UPI000BAA377B|nr:hypothetical protein CI105_01290 [Candidatus Izimaplasma bacterium ZiA1]
MLNVKKLTRKYKNGSTYINAIDDINANFNVGDFVFILGESGSGKSTLLNVLCGLDTKIDGSVSIDGIDTSTFSKKDWAIYRNHYVGFVFQEYNLIEHLKVWENVALPLQFQGLSKKQAKKKAVIELEKIGLGKFIDKLPNHLSGGQKQRVAIARAFVTDPKIIMADEPTGALDTALGDKIIAYLKEKAKDKIVVIVTHDEDLAEKFANRIITLEDGKILNDSNQVSETITPEKELNLVRPRMKLSMLFKFARNNISSRIFRSIITSSIVSIGYISIFLLTFLILGINSSIASTISSFIPEDQYQIYHIGNEEITTDEMAQISALEHVESVEYVVTEQILLEYQGIPNNSILTSVPYDEVSLQSNTSTLYGEIPSSSDEIIINSLTAANLEGLQYIEKGSEEYVFNSVKNLTVSIKYIDSTGTKTLIGEYKIVGMVVNTSMQPLVYAEYQESLDISNMINNDENIYASQATMYLNTDNEDEISDLRKTLNDNHDIFVMNLYESITSNIDDFMMKALKIFIGIASISLIVSGILIGLVVYTSILERIKEIGILTAIGAKSSSIVGIYLIESAFLGLISSIIASGVALLLTKFINGLFNNFIEKPLNLLTQGLFEMQLLSPNVLVILIVITFSILYAMLAGVIPSLRASKMNAVKALRKE